MWEVLWITLLDLAVQNSILYSYIPLCPASAAKMHHGIPEDFWYPDLPVYLKTTFPLSFPWKKDHEMKDNKHQDFTL